MGLKQNDRISTFIISNIQGLEEFKDEWSNFAKRCDENGTIYLTYEWISIRWQYFCGNCRLNILVMKKDKDVIGIFPLMRKIHSLGFLKYEAIETIGAVNCNHVGLFRDEEAEEVIEVFLDYVSHEISKKRTIVKLELVPDDCDFYKQFNKTVLSFSMNLIYQEDTMTSAPYITVNTGWGEYYNNLTPKRRKRLRKILRDNEMGQSIRYQQFSYDNLDIGLNKLFEIHRKRWQSVNIKSPFSDSRVRAFYKDIASTFFKNKWLHFSSLTVDGNIGSVLFSFIYNQKYYAATSGRDPDYEKLELGHMHYFSLIQEAFNSNLKEFDFLRGDEAYKFFWANQYRNYQGMLITAYTPFRHIYIPYLKIFLRAVQFIRNRHDLKELIALIRLQIQNRKLKKKVLNDNHNKEDS